MLRLTSLFLLSTVFFLSAGFHFSISVQAQEGPFDAFILFLNKEFPSPGDTVKASIHANKASPSSIRSVRWYVNDEEQKTFANSLDFTFIAKSAPQRITAQIIFFDSANQRSFAEVIRWVRPVIFDIFWEGDVVTTPGYRGQKYAGPRTPILLSAKVQFIDIDGAIYSEKDFSFRWQIESRSYGGRGPGVAALVYEEGGSLLNRSVTVRAFATLISSSSVTFDRTIAIPITLPKLLVYPHTLLHGLHTNLTVPKSFSLADEAITFSAYPFFFDHSAFQKDTIHYRWFAGSEREPLHTERRVDISAEGGSVSIPLRILVEHETETTQRVENSFTVEL